MLPHINFYQINAGAARDQEKTNIHPKNKIKTNAEREKKNEIKWLPLWFQMSFGRMFLLSFFFSIRLWKITEYLVEHVYEYVIFCYFFSMSKSQYQFFISGLFFFTAVRFGCVFFHSLFIAVSYFLFIHFTFSLSLSFLYSAYQVHWNGSVFGIFNY